MAQADGRRTNKSLVVALFLIFRILRCLPVDAAVVAVISHEKKLLSNRFDGLISDRSLLNGNGSGGDE